MSGMNLYTASKLGQATSGAVNASGASIDLNAVAATFMTKPVFPRMWTIMSTVDCWVRQVPTATGIVYATHVTAKCLLLKANVYWPVTEDGNNESVLVFIRASSTDGTLYAQLNSHLSDTNLP
jgi:hypothetical protein